MNYDNNDDYSKIGPNPLLDPLHRIAYASLTAFFGVRFVAISAFGGTLNTDQLKYLWLDLIKDTTFDYFLITLHYYAAEAALERRITQGSYDANKIKETEAGYSFDQTINIGTALLITLYLFYDVNEPVYYFRLANRQNVTLTFRKKFDLVAEILSKLTIASTLLASDSYVLNEARRPVTSTPTPPPRPS
jgi:hypothetical protein